MGIYDRDYMRRNARESVDTPQLLARNGVILAGCIVFGILFVAGPNWRNTTEREEELRAARDIEEKFDSIAMQSLAVHETPAKLRRLLDINTATVDELQTVPNVGATLAASIISHRPYGSLDELDKAPGIGKRKIEMLRPYLTVE
jgi:Helix-hairpin-helix motif